MDTKILTQPFDSLSSISINISFLPLDFYCNVLTLLFSFLKSSPVFSLLRSLNSCQPQNFTAKWSVMHMRWMVWMLLWLKETLSIAESFSVAQFHFKSSWHSLFYFHSQISKHCRTWDGMCPNSWLHQGFFRHLQWRQHFPRFANSK